MKRPYRTVMLATVVLPLACRGSDPIGASIETAEGTTDGFEVSVVLSGDAIVAGEELLVAVRAENVSSRVLSPALGPCVLTFEVLDTAGAVVTAGQPCPLALWTDQLAPGEAYEFVFVWHGDAGAAPQDFLPAGTYGVRGILDLRNGAVRSAPVEVRLER